MLKTAAILPSNGTFNVYNFNNLTVKYIMEKLEICKESCTYT